MSLRTTISIHGVSADNIVAEQLDPGATVVVRLGGRPCPACLFFDDVGVMAEFAAALLDAAHRIRVPA